MSVIEGQGEVCDPSNATCATADIADNSRTISGGTNPEYYEHIVALLQPADPRWAHEAFHRHGQGLRPPDRGPAGRGPPGPRRASAAATSRSLKDSPVATCAPCPGFSATSPWLCLLPARRSSTAATTTDSVLVRLHPTAIALGGTSTLTWDAGTDTDAKWAARLGRGAWPARGR